LLIGAGFFDKDYCIEGTGIKKIIEFLKTSFDAGITEAENKITF
jgi:hypothetical protein